MYKSYALTFCRNCPYMAWLVTSQDQAHDLADGGKIGKLSIHNVPFSKKHFPQVLDHDAVGHIVHSEEINLCLPDISQKLHMDGHSLRVCDSGEAVYGNNIAAELFAEVQESSPQHLYIISINLII